MRDFDKELSEWGLTPESYEACLEDVKNKSLGLNDLDWQEIVEKYNLGIHYDTLRKASQTIFGNVFVSEYFREKKVLANETSNGYLQELKQAKLELQKEKIKTRDERTDLQKTIREEARRESFIETIERIFKQNISALDYVPKKDSIQNVCKDELVVCLSDLHCGLEVKNFLNKYNSDIMKARLTKYLDKIIEIQSLHNCKKCYVVIGGDIISGLIHPQLRIMNNEDVITQLKISIDYISEFIMELSKYFEGGVAVNGVAGNHSRIMPNKEDSLNAENLEEMVLYCLKLKFNNIPYIQILDNNLDNTIGVLHTEHKLFYVVHGDKDSVNSVVPNLTLMTGIKPDGVIMGHRHHNALETIHGVKIIQCGCVIGTDDYCIDKRISGKPEQICFITNDEDTVKCLYNVEL